MARRKTASNVRRITDEHKNALQDGRAERLAVERYLTALAELKQRPRRRTPDEIRARIAEVKVSFDGADVVERVLLRQQLIDLDRELVESQVNAIDLPALEDAFVGVVRSYSTRKSITWTAWRAEGVPAEVLRRAGLPQTRQRRVA